MNKKQKTINKKQITEFIQSLSSVKRNLDIKKMKMFFSSRDLGTIYLDNEELMNYREVLHSLIKNMDPEIISPKTIEKRFQNTILKSLDLDNNQNSIPLDKRIKDSITSLEKSLNETPKNIILYYPLEGLAEEGLPFKFGKVEFCVFTAEDYSLFENSVKNNWSDKQSKKKLLETIEEIKKGKLYEKPVAKIEVNTVDYDAAVFVSRKDLVLSIDVLNFYSDLLPYQNGFIFLPGESQQTYLEIPMLTIGNKPGVHIKYRSVGPIRNFSIAKLKQEDRKKNLGLTKISNLIAKCHNHLEDRIISAMRWAGSATVEQDKEKAFLEYAISLETVILFENDKAELTNRLATRVAQLLSEDVKSCIEIRNNIKTLYKIRSDIVHNGKYQVSDSNLALIRYYVKRSILRLLTDQEFDSMDKNNLLDWFNKRTFQ